MHILAGTPVFFRIDGSLQPLSEDAVSASMARHLACGLLSDRHVATLDERPLARLKLP